MTTEYSTAKQAGCAGKPCAACGLPFHDAEKIRTDPMTFEDSHQMLGVCISRLREVTQTSIEAVLDLQQRVESLEGGE